MGYEARILADSLGPSGKRLTTFELTYPRFVHAELMTHRLFSRNSASSRAIPIDKMIERVIKDPAMPVYWGRNQAGMQAAEELTGDAYDDAISEWLCARDEAIGRARELQRLGVHKQIANRLIEPWMWITVIVSATEFGNWFNLRCHPDAQPEIKRIADMMRDLYHSTPPVEKEAGDWHLPLTGFPGDEGLSAEELRKVSVGRCARVSYLTHDGKRDPSADVQLCDRLRQSGHWSPFEHVAQALERTELVSHSNFSGWLQYRKTFFGEHRGHYEMPEQ